MIPTNTKDSLDLYAKFGCPVGGFLESVVSNDLFEAVERADEFNTAALAAIVSYIYNDLPVGCWGCHEKYAAWLERGGIEGGRHD